MVYMVRCASQEIRWTFQTADGTLPQYVACETTFHAPLIRRFAFVFLFTDGGTIPNGDECFTDDGCDCMSGNCISGVCVGEYKLRAVRFDSDGTNATVEVYHFGILAAHLKSSIHQPKPNSGV